MSHYKTLLSVAVEHGYYSSGVCASLDFQPTPKTRELVEKAGLLLRKTADGIRIIHDRDRLDALEMFALDASDAPGFDFKVFATDSGFRNYTEPYTGARGEVLYFDNRSADGSGKQSLTASEFVSERDMKSPDSAELNETLSQKDRLLPPEFVLRIYFDSDAGPQLKYWLEQPPTIYSISFNSRQRYWKYYLLGRIAEIDESKNRYSIVDPDNGIEFETTGREVLSGKYPAYTFRSKQRIPLYERYPFRFQLRQTGEAGESTLIPRLPVASIDKFGSEAIAEQEIIVSEIYVNS